MSRKSLASNDIGRGEVFLHISPAVSGGWQWITIDTGNALRARLKAGAIVFLRGIHTLNVSRWYLRWQFLFRFRLRTFLIFVALVAILSAWLGKHAVRTAVQRSVVAKINTAGGTVYYQHQQDPELKHIDTRRLAPGAEWLRAVLGDDFFATVTFVKLDEPTTTDAVVTELPRLRDLLDVSLDGAGVTDACVDDLLQISKLRSLSLSNTSISADGIRRLSQSETLQSITLWGSNATDEHLKHLPDFQRLRHVALIRSPVTDVGMASIGKLRGLISLKLFEAKRVTDRGFASLRDLRELQELHVLNTAITDQSLKTIARFKKLWILHLWGLPSAGNTEIRSLAQLGDLRYLFVQGSAFGDAGMESLSNCKKLEHVNASDTKVTDRGVAHVVTLPKLKWIDLGNTAITNAGLLPLAVSPSITWIAVGINSDLTMEGVEDFKAKRPECAVECREYDASGGWTVKGAK